MSNPGYAAVKRTRAKTKKLLVEEAGGRCVRCGYDRCLRALVFHHRDPATKLFALGKNTNVALGKARLEAAKCDLLCANCHAEVHDEQDKG